MEEIVFCMCLMELRPIIIYFRRSQYLSLCQRPQMLEANSPSQTETTWRRLNRSLKRFVAVFFTCLVRKCLSNSASFNVNTGASEMPRQTMNKGDDCSLVGRRLLSNKPHDNYLYFVTVQDLIKVNQSEQK